jgi:hypothetical protein
MRVCVFLLIWPRKQSRENRREVKNGWKRLDKQLPRSNTGLDVLHRSWVGCLHTSNEQIERKVKTTREREKKKKKLKNAFVNVILYMNRLCGKVLKDQIR